MRKRNKLDRFLTKLNHDTRMRWVELDRAKVPDVMREAYRAVFSTELGRVVLSHMLNDLQVFAPIVDEDDIVLSNYGKYLLKLTGVTEKYNMKRMVDAMMKFPTDAVNKPSGGGDMLQGGN